MQERSERDLELVPESPPQSDSEDEPIAAQDQPVDHQHKRRKTPSPKTSSSSASMKNRLPSSNDPILDAILEGKETMTSFGSSVSSFGSSIKSAVESQAFQGMLNAAAGWFTRMAQQSQPVPGAQQAYQEYTSRRIAQQGSSGNQTFNVNHFNLPSFDSSINDILYYERTDNQ